MSVGRTTYEVLRKRLVTRAADARQPAIGTFELTSRCNLGCRMCYVRGAANDAALRSGELSATQWVALAREARDQGMVFLLLTGGEVFLRPDFFDIYEPLTRMGLMLTLFTNGTLITASVADRLAQAPPSRTEVTLYGATEATFQAVTGVPGSYRRCVEGIERLVEHKLPTALKCTLTRQNGHELEAMRDLARGWRLPLKASWVLTKRVDGGESEAVECRLLVAECVRLEAEERGPVQAGPDRGQVDLHTAYSCCAGKCAFYIDARGAMQVCAQLPLPGSRVPEVGFAAAWQEVRNLVETTPLPDAECLSCDTRAACPRCPAWSWVETGTLTRPVPYLCEIARERKAWSDGCV